jgi:hypothetical protein
MYNMDSALQYLKNPIILSLFGSLFYYIIERFDCYINARKTASLNRRTIIVFIILCACTYYISLPQESTDSPEILTDIGNF